MRDVIAFGDTDITGSVYNLTDDYGNLLTTDTGDQLVTDEYRDLEQPAADMFDKIVSTSHEMAARCDIVFGGEVIEEDVNLVNASITYDRTAARLARVSNLVIADPDRIPRSATDHLSPYGYELQLWRGVSAADGKLLVPLGVFPIQSSKMDAITRSTAAAAHDRSQRVSDARFEDDYSVTASTNYATAIETLINDGVPGLTYLFPSTTYTTPPVLVFGRLTDRWDAAVQMAKNIGNEIYFDGLGRCVMRAEPTFTDTASYTIADAQNLVTASINLDRATAYNRVIATSTNASTGEVYQGIATDDNPASPTYYYGPFGKKPRGYPSPFLNSNAQAESAAAAVLASNLGVVATTDATFVPNPRIETSDVGLVTCSALGLDELHIIDSQVIDINEGAAMEAGIRAQQAAA